MTSAMLRLTPLDSAAARTFKVEGRITGPLAVELDRAVEEQLSRGPLVLDLSDVTHVDRRGAQVLRTLQGRGATLANSPRFVTALIDGGPP